MTKVRSKKVIFNGIKFDSKKECKYYQYLLALKNAGDIKEIELQPRFLLIEGFRHEAKESPLEAKSSGFEHNQIKGKLRDTTYTADFRVILKNGKEIVIDVKSSKKFQDEVYRIKKKMFLKKYPDVDFYEVY